MPIIYINYYIFITYITYYLPVKYIHQHILALVFFCLYLIETRSE